MSMTVKAYLDRGSEAPEIRRFAVDQTVSASLTYLKGKISQVFPTLGNKQYNLFWKDSDGDLVLFSSDDELTEALGFVTDGVFRVYIRPADTSDSGVLHSGVVCDGCEKEIRGARFKCITCPDYDLCACCECKGKHNQHDMLRMCTPKQGGFPPFMFFGSPPPPPHHGHHPGAHPPPPPPPPPPGPEGCGEAGPWGNPWRRWMKRCWRRMMREQWGAPDAFGPGYGPGEGSRDSSMDSSKTTKSSETSEGAGCSKEQHQEKQSAEKDAPEEYLRNMGESVAAMLDPLGIDVHVDIEHNGEQQHVRGRRGGRGRGRGYCRGRGGRRGPWGMFGAPWNFGAYGAWGPHGQFPPQQPPQSEQPQPEPAAAADRDDEMQTETSEPSKTQDARAEQSPSQGGDGWTMLNKDKEEDEQMRESQDQSADATVVYPQLPSSPVNPQHAEALAHLKAMGYSDEGGWLTNLLEAKGGNINRVLDALQPKQ